MFKKLDNCPSCNHTKFSNQLIVTDKLVSNDAFALVKCEKCGLVFTNPRPEDDHLGSYYKSDNYISHTSKANNPVNLAYKLVRSITLNQKIKLIKSIHHNAQKLFDYGCGTGHFVQHAQKKGYAITALEPDPDANKLAREVTGRSILTDIKDLDKEKFDVITAWHVLEHVADLNNTFKQLRKSLDDKGVMFIAVPNLESHDAVHYQENWAGYDVPRHLYHFSPNSFKQFAKQHKMKLVNTIPMKFDAFYVSMLSEKYIHGKNNYISAIKSGIQSNQLARQTGNYSSLIYVLKK